MVSSDVIPWYNRPPRRFPVHLWLERRYGFRVPPLRFVQPVSQPEGPRLFPAKVWLEQRHRRKLTV
jgi:hypothetical protein